MLIRDSCSMAPGSVVEWKKVTSHSLLARAYHVTVGKIGSVICPVQCVGSSAKCAVQCALGNLQLKPVFSVQFSVQCSWSIV